MLRAHPLMSRSLQEAVFGFAPARWVIAALIFGRGAFFHVIGRRYRALLDFCWVERVSRVAPLRWMARRVIYGTIDTIQRTGRNVIRESFRSDPASAACAARYSITGGGSADLFRDVMVLKQATADEKGVILLKYAKTFDAVAAIFDLRKLMERYTFVLEPCWAGYCDPSLLMFLEPDQPVVVQCFTEDDHAFVAQIGAPFVTVRLGPASWVDAKLFKPRAVEAKTYDLVMVANWQRHKRHATLFKALRKITDRRVRVLLIGFPFGGRTADDIRREASAIGNELIDVEVIEQVPASQVADYVSQCKVFVFLSRKEGDNKALVEAMFAGVPSIVYEATIGGAGSRINAQTGIFSSDEDLTANILHMLDHYTEFSPATWARQNAGSEIATATLNEVLKRIAAQSGVRYVSPIVEKTNSPNLAYADAASRARFQADYDDILAAGSGRHEVRGAVA